MRLVLSLIGGWLIGTLVLVIVCLLALLSRRSRRTLIWGCTPILNNRYWSEAMKAAGYRSQTLMRTYYSRINVREDFDLYFEDLVPAWLRLPGLRNWIERGAVLLYVLREAKIVHMSYDGLVLGDTPLWFLEPGLLKSFGIFTLIVPYGADGYLSSEIQDPSLRHALLISYPHLARQERRIRSRIDAWNRQADIVMPGFMLDGNGRWDCLLRTTLVMDQQLWQPKALYSEADGRQAPVRIAHAPNHRGFKGSEFLIQAVAELQAEGLQIDFELLEGLPNQVVREKLQQADILVEQLITGYGLNAVEGLSTGLVVISNLEDERYNAVFRRYSYFQECPVVSAEPETIKQVLRRLIADPGLRRELGRAGRLYAEKYHSYAFAQYLFGAVYSHLFEQPNPDLIHLFHPLKSDYNRRLPLVNHPLIRHHLPP